MSETVNDTGERVVKTVCSVCYCGCGVFAHVKDGKVVKITGDPDHPNNKGKLCPKGVSGIELLYHPDRLNYPLKRAGERGEGKWDRISWEEALETIGSRLNQIKAENGPESICVGTGGGLYYNGGMLNYFASLLGTPNRMSAGYICFMPTAMAALASIGYPAAILASEMVFDEVLNSKCVLLWAANPRNSLPYPLGEGIFEVKEQGAKLIVVDPRPTDYAREADIWLQIRPATDDALALGMIHVIINEGLHDKKFVDEWTFGFEELKKHVQDYPPEKVSRITGAPGEDIVAAARMFANTGPSIVCTRVPLDQNLNAVQSSRAIFILNAICGNLDIKGGNLLPAKRKVLTENAVGAMGSKLPREVLERRIGAKEIPLLSGPDAPAANVQPALLAKSILTGDPYPVKALITCGRNHILGNQDTRTFENAFKSLDFSVTMDLFMTPTTELSDIVLPAVSWLERDGVRGHPVYPYITPIQHKAIEPLHERWDDNKFLIELTKKMDFDIPWKDLDAYHDFRVKEVASTFKELEGTTFIAMPKEYERHTKGQFEFNTPSKKIELYSTYLEKHGYDPLPHYKAPPETTSDFPFILIAGKKNLEFVHSAGRQINMLRKRVPEPTIEINPETAEEKGIQDGDWVWLETITFGDKERVRFKAKRVEGSLPLVVTVEHGWWYPEVKDPEHGCHDSNVNVVITGDLYDPIYGSTNLKSVPCRIYKA